MSRHPAHLHLCLLVLCALAGKAVKADTGTAPSPVIEQHAQSYVVDRDGSYSSTVGDVRACVPWSTG